VLVGTDTAAAVPNVPGGAEAPLDRAAWVVVGPLAVAVLVPPPQAARVMASAPVISASPGRTIDRGRWVPAGSDMSLLQAG
jgi:hypothetical protein